MSDKPKKEAESKPAADGHGEEKPRKKGLLSKLPVLLGGCMILEAVVLFAGMKIFGGSPKKAQAEVTLAEGHDAEPKAEASAHEGGGGHEAASAGHGGAEGAAPEAAAVDEKRNYEVTVVDFKATNMQSGRTTFYDVQFKLVTSGKHKARVERAIAENDGLIRDKIGTIMRQNDPAKLNGGSEPGLETLRRQVKFQLDEIIDKKGEGLVQEVLIPRCTPYRADF